MIIRFFFILALLFGAYYYFRSPSPETIAKRLIIHTDEGTIKLGENTFVAEWGPQTSYHGDLRYVGRSTIDDMPFITNDAVLTTGEFSDPDVVFVSDISGGNMFWRTQKRGKPEGTLVVLHFVPANVTVFKALDSLEQFDQVTVVGRIEEDRKIVDENDELIGGFRHDNHEIMLVEEVRKEQ